MPFSCFYRLEREPGEISLEKKALCRVGAWSQFKKTPVRGWERGCSAVLHMQWQTGGNQTCETSQVSGELPKETLQSVLANLHIVLP